MADRLYRQGTRDFADIADLLSVKVDTARTYTRDARSDEKAERKALAWDRWLDCHTQQAIADELGVAQPTVNEWLSEAGRNPVFDSPPDSRQHFDVWNLPTGDDGSASHFGRMPAGVVENLLWLWTEPGDVVFDPFAGGGTTIDVAKRMGRRVWASDLHPATPTLPIHAHDITTGWPTDAPAKADLIILDPPYWQQAKGRYSESADDLANMTLEDFMASWESVIKVCADHLSSGGRLAYIVSPTQLEDGTVVDHGFEMYRVAIDHLRPLRRVIVPYSTQQATGQQVTWARDERKLLKLYRDLVVMQP